MHTRITKQQKNTLVNHYMHSTLEGCEDERASGEISQHQYEGITLTRWGSGVVFSFSGAPSFADSSVWHG